MSKDPMAGFFLRQCLDCYRTVETDRTNGSRGAPRKLCPECRAERKRVAHKLANGRWYDANSEEIRRRKRERYASDPEARKAQAERNRKWNSDARSNEQAKAYLAARKRKRYANDPEYRQRVREQARRRYHARKDEASK